MSKIFMDGCFDLFHYGHCNAIRQARELGSVLVCGVNSYDDIIKNKGLPVMSDDERYEVVNACRWVDETVKHVPYSPDISLIKSLGCSIVVHGSDQVTNSDGDEVYKELKGLGKYREFERTADISTTEIVGRMMLLGSRTSFDDGKVKNSLGLDRLIEKFKLDYKKHGRVIYLDGHFDLYHAGHCKAIENAKKHGDYLIIGLHSDKMVKTYLKSWPVCNEKERKLALMSNKHVNEVICAPYVVDEEFILKNGITHIFGSYDINDLSRFSSVKDFFVQDFSANEYSYLCTSHIVNRIISNYQLYSARQTKKNNK